MDKDRQTRIEALCETISYECASLIEAATLPRKDNNPSKAAEHLAKNTDFALGNLTAVLIHIIQTSSTRENFIPAVNRYIKGLKQAAYQIEQMDLIEQRNEEQDD